MKKSSMKIPPLSQLYQQKMDFSVHKKKLQKIKSDRKANLLREVDNRTQQSIMKRHLNNHSLKFNAKSLEIAKENSKIMRKIESIKPAYVFRQSLDLSDRESRSSHMINSRSRIVEQEKANYRLKERVQSMNSSLNNKKLLDDYRRSMQIKKRITHFKTEENKVVLKVEKYLGSTPIKSANTRSQEMFKKLVESPQSFPVIDSSSGRELIEKKLNKNVAVYYNKDDIIKNKVKINTKLFKFAREKRLKVLLNQEKSEYDKSDADLASKKSNPSIFFPTQPEKSNK